MLASRPVRALAGIGVAAALACVLAGCPRERPCAYVERAADAGELLSGACVTLACPLGALPSATGRCACTGGTTPLLGGCVDRDVGERYCGKSGKLGVGGCTRVECAAGEALDWRSGLCLPEGSFDHASGVRLQADEHASCPEDAAAVVVGERAWCIERGAVCGRGARAPSGLCDAQRCAAGEVHDETTDRCVRVVTADRGEGRVVVEVAQWARAVLGPDGGRAAQTFCAPLVFETAGAGAVMAGRIGVTIALEFPNNDVSLVSASYQSHADTDSRSVESASIRAALESAVEPLRAIGGTASAANVTLTVYCDLPAAEPPSVRAARDGG